MKLNEIFPLTFRPMLEEIDRQTAERASRELILYHGGSTPLWQQHRNCDSAFCRACVSMGYLTQQQMQRAAQRYRLGMSRDGGVIFWQFDQLGQVCDGKIMYYRPDCHRDKQRKPTWVSNCLKRFYLATDDPLNYELQPSHGLFGLQQLKNLKMQQCNNVTIAVVEAEKTAVILSERFPEYLWLAAGGLTELTAVKLFPLRGHKIILFPDTDTDLTAYSTWYRVAQEASKLLGQPVTVSPILEQRATPAQKAAKIDLIDYLFPTD